MLEPESVLLQIEENVQMLITKRLFDHLPVLAVDIHELNFPAVCEENKIRNRIKRKTRDSLELARKNHAAAAVHLGANDCLLTAYVGPEEKPTNRVNCDASWLFRISLIDNTDRVVILKTESDIIDLTNASDQ